MLYLKTDEEIALIKESNQLVSKTLAEVARHIQPGVSTLYLDSIAETFIRDHSAVPAFKGYNGFPATLCTSVNDQVVHGIPSKYTLKEGDIISVDCGVILDGWYGDSAILFRLEIYSRRLKSLSITPLLPWKKVLKKLLMATVLVIYRMQCRQKPKAEDSLS
jgi:methionyl aminopeptidase